MRKYVYGLGAIIVPVLLGATLTAGCTDENGNPIGGDICGPCGEIANGDVGISGDVRLDGFFKALGTINAATTSIKADFDANIRALAAVYDVELGATINTAAVTELTGAIEADITANVDGGLQVVYQPPQCQASINVAFQAQARCEAQADCAVDVNPGELSVDCQGQCTGGCSGSCTGDFSCEVTPPQVACDGKCEGSCTLEAGGTCNGTCRGDCAGTCSARDGEGNCAGECTGECTGTCELTVAAECTGRCSGKCLVAPGSAQCTGEVGCRGSCDAQCTGSCQGNFTPPSASAMCDARAECQASAKAEANASLECTPPQLTVDFVFAANANLAAQAAFTARLSELKVRGAAILQGAAKYDALISGKVNGEVVFAPSPFAQLRTSIQNLATASAIANFEIAPGNVTCAIQGFADAVSLTADIAGSTTATLAAQAEFVTAFTGGFDS